jgi:hypothetical protein
VCSVSPWAAPAAAVSRLALLEQTAVPCQAGTLQNGVVGWCLGRLLTVAACWFILPHMIGGGQFK